MQKDDVLERLQSVRANIKSGARAVADLEQMGYDVANCKSALDDYLGLGITDCATKAGYIEEKEQLWTDFLNTIEDCELGSSQTEGETEMSRIASFECPYCPVAYADKQLVKKHINSEHISSGLKAATTEGINIPAEIKSKDTKARSAAWEQLTNQLLPYIDKIPQTKLFEAKSFFLGLIAHLQTQNERYKTCPCSKQDKINCSHTWQEPSKGIEVVRTNFNMLWLMEYQSLVPSMNSASDQAVVSAAFIRGLAKRMEEQHLIAVVPRTWITSRGTVGSVWYYLYADKPQSLVNNRTSDENTKIILEAKELAKQIVASMKS